VTGDAVEKLWMTNPALPDNPAVPVTRLAYDDVWQPRGWQLVDTPPEHSELADRPAPEPEQPPADIGAEPDTDSEAGTAKGRRQDRKEVKP
jgi:hypothetical protein